jgi:hypothetical protein
MTLGRMIRLALLGTRARQLERQLALADSRPDYPSETFRVLQKNELARFGEYRTERLVLAAFDRLTGA